jgi:hypothetical protein
MASDLEKYLAQVEERLASPTVGYDECAADVPTLVAMLRAMEQRLIKSQTGTAIDACMLMDALAREAMEEKQVTIGERDG